MTAREQKIPDVSICIVTWRTKGPLEACLGSIFQTIQGVRFEVLVVDNASRDGTVEMIKATFPLVRLLENRENLGFPKAANRAIEDAGGRHILLLNPDTLLRPEAVERLVHFMDGSSAIGAASCTILNPDGTLQPECRRSFPTLTTEFFELTGLYRVFPNNRFIGQWRMASWRPRSPCEIQLASGACMMIRREAMEAVGPLSEDAFMFLEDLDYCYRLRQKGWKIYFYPDAEIIHQGQQSTLQVLPRVRALSYDARHKFFRMYYGAGSATILRLMVISAMVARLFVYTPLSVLVGGAKRRRLRFTLRESWHTLCWGITLKEPELA
jgi:GT2 family glycosyltransferase